MTLLIKVKVCSTETAQTANFVLIIFLVVSFIFLTVPADSIKGDVTFNEDHAPHPMAS